jgi:hypothetical protein
VKGVWLFDHGKFGYDPTCHFDRCPRTTASDWGGVEHCVDGYQLQGYTDRLDADFSYLHTLMDGDSRRRLTHNMASKMAQPARKKVLLALKIHESG